MFVSNAGLALTSLTIKVDLLQKVMRHYSIYVYLTSHLIQSFIFVGGV